MMNNDSLFNMTVGQQNATSKALQDAGLTLAGCKLIRSNTDAAAAVVAALQPFLRPTNPHLERHYDLSAILRLAEPLKNIEWPKVTLADNQFLVAYRGEAPSQVLNVSTKEIDVWSGLLTESWWYEGVKPGIYQVTLPLPNSGGMEKSRMAELCQKQGGVMTPFILNAIVRLAHKASTGKQVGGWTICPEITCSGYSADLRWGGAQLNCYHYWHDNTDRDLFASSSEWLSSLEG